MEEKIIATFARGDDECNHKWIYSKKGRLRMTIPPQYIHKRICEHCGKYQLVEVDTIPNATNKFDTVIEEFQYKDY